MSNGIVFCGTRPEAIKLAPVMDAFHRRGEQPRLICTSQHDALLVAEAFEPFGVALDTVLPAPPALASLGQRAAHLLSACSEYVSDADWFMVHGDTQTTWAGAWAAFLAGRPVVHLEAGLRSYSRQQPFPEEANRRSAGLLADLHLAPTQRAAEALRSERLEGRIVCTGQTSVDACYQLLGVSGKPRREWNLDGRSANVIVTAHRRENWAEGIGAIARGIARLAATTPVNVSFVTHPNPAVASTVRRELNGVARVNLLPAVPYRRFLPMLAEADLVITDSGGLQEECAALGTPFIVCRDVTERPEAIDAGCGVLLGGTPTATALAELAASLLRQERWTAMATAPNPFGDGHAAQRCVDAIRSTFGRYSVAA
jgi:UDP-N-acetylglucosamine 2-epimerase (non-hydrolysing)